MTRIVVKRPGFKAKIEDVEITSETTGEIVGSDRPMICVVILSKPKIVAVCHPDAHDQPLNMYRPIDNTPIRGPVVWLAVAGDDSELDYPSEDARFIDLYLTSLSDDQALMLTMMCDRHGLDNDIAEELVS